MPVSVWSDEFRHLSPVASSEPGRWRTARTPYLREIMDALSPDNPVKRVVVMAGAQLGKTECGNNWLGSIIHQTPGPMLYVEPTLDVVKKVSQQRIAPMIEATPVLRDAVSEVRSKDTANTIQIKAFRGGLLLMTGANSAAGLRSMPVRFLFFDEVDEYPGDVEGQGDPVSLAEKRAGNFPRRKTLLTSTPTVRGVSRIEREYLASDQRRYFVPCPECGHMDWIQWTLGGRRGDEGAHHHMVWDNVSKDPESIRLACSGCGVLIEERHKTDMLARGEWRSTLPADKRWNGKTAGFHISSLYSPLGWRSWAECLSEFFDVKDDPFRLKTWVNTVLGETFEEAGDALEVGTLRARADAEVYDAEVPTGVGSLVCAVDVQGDRLEAQVVGFGAGEEWWLVAFEQLMGDPERQDVWLKLDTFRRQTFENAAGRKLRAETTVVDTGGHATEAAYRYCSTRKNERVYAIKGGSIDGRPLVERPSAKNKYGIPLYILCVSTGKDMLMGRLHVNHVGPGYVHLPPWIDDEYLAQLTAERRVRTYVKGRGSVSKWEQVRKRNEAFDLSVYSLAALHMCGRAFVAGLGERARLLAIPPKPAADAQTRREPPKRKGWATRY